MNVRSTTPCFSAPLRLRELPSLAFPTMAGLPIDKPSLLGTKENRDVPSLSTVGATFPNLQTLQALNETAISGTASNSIPIPLAHLLCLWGGDFDPTLQARQRYLVVLAVAPGLHRLDRVLDFPPVQLPPSQLLQIIV